MAASERLSGPFSERAAASLNGSDQAIALQAGRSEKRSGPYLSTLTKQF